MKTIETELTIIKEKFQLDTQALWNEINEIIDN